LSLLPHAVMDHHRRTQRSLQSRSSAERHVSAGQAGGPLEEVDPVVLTFDPFRDLDSPAGQLFGTGNAVPSWDHPGDADGRPALR
jgi:hypothetical protein